MYAKDVFLRGLNKFLTKQFENDQQRFKKHKWDIGKTGSIMRMRVKKSFNNCMTVTSSPFICKKNVHKKVSLLDWN